VSFKRSPKAPGLLLLLASLASPSCGNAEALPQPPALLASPGQDPEVTLQVTQAREAVLAAPTDLNLRSKFAMVLDANSLDQSAQLAWQQVCAMELGNARAFYHLSKVAERNGAALPSLEAIENCVGLDPDYGPAQARLGRLLMESGELERAQAAFEAAMRLDPRSPRGALGLARLSLAQGDATAAIAWLNPVLARNVREPYAHALLARAYVLQGDEASAQIHLLAEERAGAPSGGDLWTREVKRHATGKLTRISRAKSALERGDAHAALAQVEPLWDRRFDEQAVVETLCEIRMTMGQPEMVLELLDETEAGFDQAYSLLLYRARAERDLGNEPRALEAAQKAMLLNPRRMEAAAYGGQLLFAAERYSEAVVALAQARENGDDSLQTLAFLARARAQAGDLAQALQDLEHATQSYPTIPKPWAYRAEVLAMAGQHEEADQSLQQAVSLGLDHGLVELTSSRLTELRSPNH
jgi:tetratricopeptide (TPR) repeat protein